MRTDGISEFVLFDLYTLDCILNTVWEYTTLLPSNIGVRSFNLVKKRLFIQLDALSAIQIGVDAKVFSFWESVGQYIHEHPTY